MNDDLLFLQGTPFGHVPFLDFGDARIAQSSCILRFVAKLAGMDAADESKTAAAMVDMTADATIDFLLCEREKIFKISHCSNLWLQ